MKRFENTKVVVTGAASGIGQASAIRFAQEGATLALHTASGGPGTGPDTREVPAGRCRPGLTTTDLDGFHARMVAASVACLQEPREVFGTRIAQYLDPDGLAFSVSQERGA